MYGNEQLFYRGCVRAFGIPIYLARGIMKIIDLNGTEWERISVEIATNFIRALILIPIQTWSLFHQWRYTGTASHKPSQEDDEHAEFSSETQEVSAFVKQDISATEITRQETNEAQKNADLNKKEAELLRREADIAKKEEELTKKDAELSEKEIQIAKKDAQLMQFEAESSRHALHSSSKIVTSL